MIWCVEYSKRNGAEQDEIINVYAVENYKYLCEAREHDLKKVYDHPSVYYVYLEANTKELALKEAKRIFTEYFEHLATKAEDYIELKLGEVKGFEVGDAVKVVRPTQQFTTFHEAIGGLLQRTYEYYFGPFTVGGSVRNLVLESSVFVIIAKGKLKANEKENMTLYMIAKKNEAEKHRFGSREKSEKPLEVFVFYRKGLEKI